MRFFSIIFFLGSNCSEYEQVKQEPIITEFPNILLDPEEIDFGPVPQGNTGSKTLRIGNDGEANLIIDDIYISRQGPFSLTVPSPLTELPPDEWMEVVVEYQPTTQGETAQTVVETNQPGTPQSFVPLYGSMAYPAILIEPNPKIVAWTEVGSVREDSLAIVSSGEVPVTVENILLGGEGFTIDQPELPVTLDPGESLPINLYFSPLEERLHEGEIWIGSTAIAAQTRGRIFSDAGDGILKGRICDPSGGGWVVGANVYISLDYDGDGIEDRRLEDITDSEGFFELDGLTVGLQTVYIQKGSFLSSFEVDFPGGTYELPDPECLNGGDIKIAVVGGDYDHIESIISQFDLGFDFYSRYAYLDFLLDIDTMNTYDIIFFNCGMPFNWLGHRGQVATNLRDYVDEGGSVYASDWAHMIIEAAWPNQIEFVGNDGNFFDPSTAISLNNSAFVGRAASITADVLDQNMQGLLGSSTANLNYDLDAWVVMESASTDTAILVRGNAPTYDPATFTPNGVLQNVPLAVRFSPGGTVIYTTFHNETQITIDMEAVLKEIILSL